jgi:hypothetical protein
VENFTISNCYGEVNIEGGAYNIGFVRPNGSARNTVVQNCVIVGPGRELNRNTAGVMVFRSPGLKVLNNIFRNFPKAVFYKHTCVPRDTGIEFAYNIIEQCRYGIYSCAQYAHIHDNLVIGSNHGIAPAPGTGGSGNDGDNHGGDLYQQDQHSINRPPMFIGGTTFDSYTDYQLHPDSPGAIENGPDWGADISLIGPDRAQAPMPAPSPDDDGGDTDSDEGNSTGCFIGVAEQ